MIGFILAGSMGAVLNCALASYFSTSFDYVLQELFMTPLSTMKTVLPAVFGFFGGTLVLFTWHFLKARVLRFLLDYNGWFLHPRRKINKLWYLMMMASLGRKNRGVGSYQDYLPSLPVPALKDTCKKYVNTVRPLLTPEEYEETKTAVQEFLKKDGPKLQFFLKLRSWFTRDWLSTWWVKYIYLRQRTPTPLSSNYYAMGKVALPTPYQLDRTAMLLYSSATYVHEVKNHTAESPRANDIAPFCVGSYRYLYRTARIPGVEVDSIACHDNDKPRHAVIYRLGKFYQVQVLSDSGRVLPPKGIKQQLEKVVEMAGNEWDRRGIGSFTALPRTKWANIRQRLEKSAVNRDTLWYIDSAFAFVCLEDEEIDQDDLTEQSRFFFHGNGHNRWFDKSIQLIVSSNAVVGANCEHAPLDATVAGQLWEYMLTDEEFDENGRVMDPFRGQKLFDVPPPTELKWELEGFEDDLAEARQHWADLISTSDMVVVSPGYGKSVPKKCKLSPDGWFQMAMQLAYYRLHKKIVLTYESATTRLYYNGRTGTIRPVSEMSVQFCESMDNPDVPRDDVKNALKKAIEYQCQYKMETMRGLGVDRHLFGLYIVAKGLKMDPLPRLFQDKAFNLSFLLSTSQTPVKVTNRWTLKNSSIAGGFGTVSEEGYGVSYIVVGEDMVNFTVHSKKTCAATDSQKLGDHIVKALIDMKNLYGV